MIGDPMTAKYADENFPYTLYDYVGEYAGWYETRADVGAAVGVELGLRYVGDGKRLLGITAGYVAVWTAAWMEEVAT